MGKEMLDRRVTQRIPFETEVTIQFSDGKPAIQAAATNISVGGMHFILPKGAVKLPPEEIITLNFYLPDRTQVSIRGEVCRFSNSLDHMRKPVVCYAVKFQEVSQHIWSYIYEFCQIRYSGEEFDQSQRPTVAPQPLQQLNQGSNPTHKPSESGLPATDPTLMEWTLKDAQAGSPPHEEIASGSFITPPDEPLMNWVFNNKPQEPKSEEKPPFKAEESAVPNFEPNKVEDPVPPNVKTGPEIESHDMASAEPSVVPEEKSLVQETPSLENQVQSLSSLEDSMAQLLKQLDHRPIAKETVNTALESTVTQETASHDAAVPETLMESPENQSAEENASEEEPENMPVREQNDMEQPPLKRSLFSWSRKTSASHENDVKDRLTEDSVLSMNQTSTDTPLKPEDAPALDFDVHFNQNTPAVNTAASTVPEPVQKPEPPIAPEKPSHPIENPATPPEFKPIPQTQTSFNPEPLFSSVESKPLPPKEPEKPAAAEEIDLSFMNRNSSMISLDQQMIDRIIHAMRTNSKKDPMSNSK